MLPSEYVPVAVNCCAAPVKILAIVGVNVMDVRVGGGGAWTVRVPLPATPSSVAEMVVVPAEIAVA